MGEAGFAICGKADGSPTLDDMISAEVKDLQASMFHLCAWAVGSKTVLVCFDASRTITGWKLGKAQARQAPTWHLSELGNPRGAVSTPLEQF